MIGVNRLRSAALTLPSADRLPRRASEGLTLPGNQTFVFDQNDPSLIAARNLAHSKGWSQQDFSEALGLFAGHHAAQEPRCRTLPRRISKAGVNAPARVDAVGALLPRKWEKLTPSRSRVNRDGQYVAVHERMIQKLTSQNTASFSQSHRVAPDANEIPGSDKMTFERSALRRTKRRRRGLPSLRGTAPRR